MICKIIETEAYADQKPGTSGLRKKVRIFQQKNYLENFTQAIFNAIGGVVDQTLILGGDGRFFNSQAIQIIAKMAAANGCTRLIIGRNGHLSTPAASHLIRSYQAKGGLILSASHNPAGPQEDFGIKYNIETGSAAPQSLTDRIFAMAKRISSYKIYETNDVDLSVLGSFTLGDMRIEIIDPVEAYANLLEEIFDFRLITNAVSAGLKFYFNAMHAITGEYAIEIFHRRLGVPLEHIKNAQILENFGGEHPDPNPQNLGNFFSDFISASSGYDLGGACDGDGDRNLVLGRGQYVSPSDSLAILVAHSHLLPYYKSRLYGVARSMPTSRAVDVVAAKLAIPLYETPTGWKFFGNLLDTEQITFCGEESFGAGSLHLREKDGIWAILFWLNIIAATKKSVKQLVAEHWQTYGRHYYLRYDYLDLDCAKAEFFMSSLRSRLSALSGQQLGSYCVEKADDFAYYDNVDQTFSRNQGIRIQLATGQRLIYRLSGTGTSGAILRLYIESYEPDTRYHNLNSREVLQPFLELATHIGQIPSLLKRTAPDVII